MKIHRLTFEQHLPISLSRAWDYFSSPSNLAEITPPDMAFTISSPLTKEDKMFAGMIITYKVSPLFGIKLDWVTEITHYEEMNYFVDEQRDGPFAFWHHLHKFTPVEDGVIMRDVLHYAIGWGPLGFLANTLMVKDKLSMIFEFRKQKIEQLFSK